MFESVNVIGSGRVGSAVSARLRERGVAVRPNAELVLLCVPDTAIRSVARDLEPGPWVAHVSGGTPLAALDPHTNRFSVHPLQTLTTRRGPEQLDGAWGAVTAETPEANERALWLAEALGLLHRVASDLFRAAGAPPGALVPLMRRTIDNDFELTGPIERGDWDTVEAHRRAIRDAAPEVEPLYDVLAEATAR